MMDIHDDDFCMNQCDGHCCSSYTILVTSEDACRIVQNNVLKPEEFLVLYDSSVEDMGYYPKFYISGNEVVLGIKFQENTTTCMFLSPEGLCSIHHCKPSVCQTYPFTMDTEGTLLRMEGLTDVCPHVFWPSSQEMKDKINDSLLQSWKEVKIYRQKMVDWATKGRQGTFQELLYHIGCK